MTGVPLRSSKQVLGSNLQVGDVIEYPPGNFDPPELAVVYRLDKDHIEVLTNAGGTVSGLESGKIYLLAGRACEPSAVGINRFA
jgi:hypothetical protein